MGKLDNVRRVVKEDYDEKYHDLIDKLAFVLNSFMEQVVGEMNGSLDFENLAQELITFKITVDSSGVPTENEQVRVNITNPKGFLVVNTVDVDNTDLFVTTHPSIKFATGSSSQVVKIKQITGLTTNREYRITAIAFK